MHADTALVQRAKANDRAAFNEIVLRYKDKVYNYVYRMVRNATDAEDLTQETFVRAYLSLHSFQSRASLNTWLFRIATNLCIDHCRRAKRTQGLVTSLSPDNEEEEEGLQRDIPDATFDPQRLLLNKELGEKLEKALQELPEKLRMVVLLYDVEGLSYEEIAAIAGCPLGTVKSRLFNARAVLRRKLEPYLNIAV
ncbi:MAG TPA: sigma-70 family RNA polymerase sigma factor [Chthonomonas sp.]|uniref:sigma-70 family RNA polymerase sigma factor n=1 Tax=Chthonomonas sp. TaxID=2282153 RepID=UPI002B4B654C|nr:sigma-70 family RNA polymerase sigma factor [Chthonomonas sp.]HLI47614.1 sigma-70 family RNA polymerase sigma factor [Chthonomonas sp.]